MKVLTKSEFETGLSVGTIFVDFAWGTGAVLNFLGAMEGETDRLFKVTGL